MDKSLAEIREAAKAASAEAKRAVMAYLRFERGTITHSELLHHIFFHIDAQNVLSVAYILGERIDFFKDLLALGPKLQDEWFRHAGSVARLRIRGDDETEAECSERIAAEDHVWWERHWRGIAALQSYFRSTDPTFSG